MLRCYQPLMPGTNRLLQRRWDHDQYERHRSKVSCALPVVDTKGSRTPAHIQLKLKKLQLQDERLSIIDRDNQLLASRLASISCSKGLVDHHNQYQPRSLNADRRREELLLVGRQNQAIYQRIKSRPSEYRRQLWLDNWEKAEQRRSHITRFPRAAANDKRKSLRKVKFAALEASDQSESSGGGGSSSSSSSSSNERAAGGGGGTLCCRNRKPTG